MIKETLKTIWGYDQFRHPQEEIITSLLSHQDCLIIMPTGGGKSICFQLPALLQSGVTLVISPLVALMENQVQELHQRNISAGVLHSELPRAIRKKTLQELQQNRLKLLYLSPETFLSLPVWETLIQPQIVINTLIIDEAHCLVQWGDTFRPEYRRLGTVRTSLLKHKPQNHFITIGVFTATADPPSQKILTDVLQLNNPQSFVGSPYRDNLLIKIKTVWTPHRRKQEVIKFLKSHPQQSGLIYTRSRKESESLSQWLESLDYKSKPYHSGIPAIQRRKIEQDWLNNRLQFVICTNSFGMGINKSDVRWVIHFHAPLLLSEYLQEIGRGGRDGKLSEALLLRGESCLYPEDKQRNQSFFNRLQKQFQEVQSRLVSLPMRGDIREIQQAKDQGVDLALLHYLGYLQWSDPFCYVLNVSPSKINLSPVLKHHKKSFKLMEQFFRVKSCRWEYLLAKFGFQESSGFACGHCDNCLGRN